MILSGYLGSPEIAAVVADFVARAKARNPALLYCCDPVLGDRDRGLFVHADIPPLVRDRLCRLADIITPNHFEFEFLCGAKATTTDQMIEAAQALLARGPSTVVVTSAELVGHAGRRDRDPCRSNGRKPGACARQNCRSARPGPAICLPRCWCPRAFADRDTPDALGHAASAIFAVLERTASSGTEEMRIVESAELLAHPKRRFDAIAVRGS